MSENFDNAKGDEDFNFVRLDKFILATRDSGYKSTVSALSELIDNSIQADASEIHINLSYAESSKDIQIVTSDNGNGMKPEELRQSMRFGGSTRFDSREGIGRFGMGLPNASLSQCRRTEVHTWQGNRVFETYLDVEEISEGKYYQVPPPVAVDNFFYPIAMKNSKSGTMVTWKNCDRLDFKRITTLEKKLQRGLEQQFRYFLWEGKKIYLNGLELKAYDPLCLKDNRLPYPSEIFEEVILPFRSNETNRENFIKATFTILPLSELYKIPNAKKSELGITKGAGMSIIRAKREIDYGWFFMDKRKENYDDWWRGELMFDPQMDEYFGVSHTKQQIRPSAELTEILSNHFSPIIRGLNSLVRNTNIKLKVSRKPTKTEERFTTIERNLPKISKRVLDLQSTAEHYLHINFPVLLKQNYDAKNHQILEDNIEAIDFYNHYNYKGRIFLILNKRHKFYKKIYSPLKEENSSISNKLLDIIDTLLLTAARAEQQIEKEKDAACVENFRKEWGGILSKIVEV